MLYVVKELFLFLDIKELADRQTRPSPSDRHMLARRTARSLRALASRHPYGHGSPEFYMSRASGAGDSNAWDLSTRSTDDIDVEDIAITPPSPPPLHRFSPLDHAPTFGLFTNPVPMRRSFHVQTGEVETDEEMAATDEPARRTPAITRSSLPSRATTLTRQSSIRRASRTRLSTANTESHFSDFAARRRLAGRLDQEEHSRASGSGSGESSMDLANLLHAHYTRGDRGEDTDGTVPVSAFANALTRRGLSRARSQDGHGISSDNLSHDRYLTFHASNSSTSPGSSASRPAPNFPRLRRGGVRAPESLPTVGDGYLHTVRISSPPIPGLLSNRDLHETEGVRRSSSVSSTEIDQVDSERSDLWPPQFRGGTQENSTGRSEQSSSTINLPTPRSISPEASPSLQN